MSKYILMTPLESTLTVEETIEALEEFALEYMPIDGRHHATSSDIDKIINMAFQCDIHGEIIEVKSTTYI
jgi:hypothetical protein